MKNKQLQIRVSEELKDEIQREAEKLGLTISAYLIMLHKKNKGVTKMTINFGKFYKAENEPEYRIKDTRNNDTWYEEDFDKLFKGLVKSLKQVDKEEAKGAIEEITEMTSSNYHIGQVKTVLDHLFDIFYLKVKEY